MLSCHQDSESCICVFYTHHLNKKRKILQARTLRRAGLFQEIFKSISNKCTNSYNTMLEKF